jgi:hypothetical protein
MTRFLAGLTLLLALPWGAGADELPTYSLRQLAVDAEAIVLAEPGEKLPLPTRFRILDVLSGRGLHRGDTLTLDYGGKYIREGMPAAPKRKWKGPRIEQALLFLTPTAKGASVLVRTPVASGMRCWDADGAVLAPVQQKDGPYVLESWSTVRWNAILRRTRANVAAVDVVRRARRLARSEARNRALLRWIEQHRNEFGDGQLVQGEDEPAPGWGTLETSIFAWILESGHFDDSWLAVRLYTELNRGDLPELRPAYFGTRAGRAFLMRKAADENNAIADRLRALKVLVNRATLGVAAKSERAGQALEQAEQLELLDRMIPLLPAKSPMLRLGIVRTIGTLSGVSGSSLPQALRTRRALPALVKAYRAEPAGTTRDELAELLCTLAEPRQWQELTGNPPGLLVRVHDFARARKQVRFWLSLHRGRYKVHECPTLNLERLEKNGKVAEKKSLLLPVRNPVSWSAGWDGASFLLVQLPLEGLKPGIWRMVVTGSAGQGRDRVKWKVDSRTFEIPQPRNGMPNSPFPYQLER